MTDITTVEERASKEKGLTFGIYVLYGLSVLTIIPAFIAIAETFL